VLIRSSNRLFDRRERESYYLLACDLLVAFNWRFITYVWGSSNVCPLCVSLLPPNTMSFLSSAASSRNTHLSLSYHLAFNNPFMCDVSMVHGLPSSPSPRTVGELSHVEESPREPPEGRVYPVDLGSSHTSPIADALANLPWLDKTTVALVELYDLLDKSGELH
jgi:hypothetical protein